MADNEENSGLRGKRRWLFAGYAKKGVRAALCLSLAVFALYMAGSIPDPGFSDRWLFLLLQMLRYSSLMLGIFSIFALGFGVHRLVYHLSVRNALSLLFYFITGILGAGLAMLNSFITAAAGGNF